MEPAVEGNPAEHGAKSSVGRASWEEPRAEIESPVQVPARPPRTVTLGPRFLTLKREGLDLTHSAASHGSSFWESERKERPEDGVLARKGRKGLGVQSVLGHGSPFQGTWGLLGPAFLQPHGQAATRAQRLQPCVGNRPAGALPTRVEDFLCGGQLAHGLSNRIGRE